ncbi:hypothetical protein GCM10027575_07760 [Phytohabitans suffuscus]
MVRIRPSGGSFIPRSVAGSPAFESRGGDGAEFAWIVLLVRAIVGLSDPMRTNQKAAGSFPSWRWPLSADLPARHGGPRNRFRLIVDASRPRRATGVHHQLTNDDKLGDFGGGTAARATRPSHYPLKP